MIPILDPKTHKVTIFNAPVRDPDTPEALGPGHAAMAKPLGPSAYWGDEQIWDTKVNNHNSMIDKKGRVWMAAAVRGAKNPDFCKKGSDHPSAKLFPLEQTHRALAVLDPKTMKYTFVDTCFQTHHLQFGYDANDTLWTSSGGGAAWSAGSTPRCSTRPETPRSRRAGRALVLDTNGNGKRDDYVEPDQPVDPAKDKRIAPVFYAVMPSPVDGSVWGTVAGKPGAVVRLDPGSNPPATALAEIYNVPMPGFGPRGGDIDSKGVVWVSLASGHLGSFDRRKCKVRSTGRRRPATIARKAGPSTSIPGPGFEGIGENSAESSYYTWVDQHNTLGLGKDVPMSTGNLKDGVSRSRTARWSCCGCPIRSGFYAKGLDGRIDDPNAGWKGRGLWTTSGDRAPWPRKAARA